MQSTVYFYGAAGSVTGSNFLLDTGASKILIDCGLFQGKNAGEENNWAKFPFDAKAIPVLINTHAHIDHIGRIPLLVKRGFKGRIISTEATRAIALPLLLDCMSLLKHDAEIYGKEPLYDERDIDAAMALWEGIPYHQKIDLDDSVQVELLNSGHILGSAMAKFTRGSSNLVFTGDLGGGNSPLLPPIDDLTDANYLVMESVYGNTVRPEEEQKHTRDMLENVIEESVARCGTLLIPAFSTERTQDLLFEIRTLMVERRVPSVPVYIDSPLAKQMTEAFLAYPQYFSDELQQRIKNGEKIFVFPEMHIVEDEDESRHLGKEPGPNIILAGSGMSNGGRVIGHERRILSDKKSTLLIVGYQAAGSLGRRLVEGASQVEIHKQKVPVHCRVEAIYGYSAHMDGEQLVEFVNKTRSTLKEVFVVMGEPVASATLVQHLRDYLSVKAIAPEAGESATIEL
ncbi:MAG: MBL fold metallo-hydrolase [Minisyncoccia bacterium]|jgi:metallo-beta-lactamase family protein